MRQSHWPQVQWPDRNEVAKLDTEGPIEWLVKQCSNVIPLPDAVTSFVTKPLDAGVKKLIDSTRATRGFYKIAQVFRDYATGAINKDEYDGFFEFANKGNQYVPEQGAMSFSENYRLKHEYHYATKPYDSNGLHLRHVDRDLRNFLRSYAKPTQKNLLRQHPELKEIPQAIWDDLNAYEMTESMLIEKTSWEMRVKDSPEKNSVSALVLCKHISQHLSKYPILQQVIDQNLNTIFAKKMHKALKEYYASKNEIKGLFGKPLQLKDQYINLQLIYQSQKVEDKDKKPSEEEKKEKDDDFRDRFKQKQALALEQLFFPANALLLENQKTHEKNPDVSPDFLLIQGHAGTGKTTMVDYISYKWEQGELWQEFDWVFALRLRDLREKGAIAAWERGEIWSLSDWVYQAFFTGKDFDKATFKAAWKEQIEPAIEQGKVLFILDGYDELPSEHPCKNALKILLASTQIKKIITSRPYGTSLLREDRRNVEVVGFLDENIKKYVEFYYANQAEKSKQLLIALEANPTLWHHAHIPVLLNILCGILEEVKNEDLVGKLEKLNTRSSLYDEMELSLLERAYIHESKDEGEIEKREKQLKPLAKDISRKSAFLYEYYQLLRRQLAAIAFEVFSDDQLIISSKHLNNALERTGVKAADIETHIKALTDLGLLKPAINNDGSEASTTRGYEFLHLSFKEYYVAQYLSTLFEDNLNVLTPTIKHALERMKLNPHYQEHLWFLAGTLRNKPQQFKRLLDYLKAIQPDKIGHYELGLLIRCAEEVLDARWKAEERKLIVSPLIMLVQKKLEQLWINSYYPKFNTDSSTRYFVQNDFPLPYFVEMLQVSPRWQQLSGNEDVFYCFSTPFLTPSKGNLLAYLEWLHLCTPRVSAWLSDFLWTGKDSYISRGKKVGYRGPMRRHTVYDYNSRWVVTYELHDRCMSTLAILGPAIATRSVVDALMRGLRETEQKYQKSCAKALINLGVAVRPEVLAALATGVHDINEDYRWGCVNTIWHMGATAATPEVLAALAAGAQNKSENFSQLCANTLKKITEIKPVPSPAEKMQDKEKQVNKVFIKTFEEATPEIVDELMKEACSEKPWWFDSDRHITNAANRLSTFSNNTPGIVNTIRLTTLLGAIVKNPSQQGLEKLFAQWACIYLKQNSSLESEFDFSVLLALLVGAYAQGNVSVTIGWNGKKYTLQGYIHQDFFALQLSPKQAQWIQHYSPQIIDLLEQGRWASITVDHLECPDWTPLVMSRVIGAQRVLPQPENDDLLLKLST